MINTQKSDVVVDLRFVEGADQNYALQMLCNAVFGVHSSESLSHPLSTTSTYPHATQTLSFYSWAAITLLLETVP